MRSRGEVVLVASDWTELERHPLPPTAKICRRLLGVKSFSILSNWIKDPFVAVDAIETCIVMWYDLCVHRDGQCAMVVLARGGSIARKHSVATRYTLVKPNL